jgi:hypothetical protein
MSEETPLLVEQRRHNPVYDRFAKRKKRIIVAVVSWAGLLPCKHFVSCFSWVTGIHYCFIGAVFVTGSFIPAIPQIANDLNSTGPVIR